MLTRFIGYSVRRTLVLPARTLRMTAVVRGGGGHHHHEPTPVHIPQPGPWERNWFGEGKAPRISEDAPYTPSFSCYTSYIGAAVGVLLTFLAIANYTEAFKKDKGHHAAPHRPTASEHHEPVQEKEPEPVVEAVVEEPEPVVEKVDVEEEKVVEETKTETPDVPGAEGPTEAAPAEPVKVETPAESTDETPNAVEKVPEYVEYLLVGAGTASYYASIAIRARDADAKVIMIGDEPHIPYNRPPLSKELWWYESSPETLIYKGLNGKKRDVFFESPGFFVPVRDLEAQAHGGVSLLKGRRVTRICATEKKAFLDDGNEIRFGKCLLATGGKPKSLPELEKCHEAKEKVLYLRGVDDYKKLDRICSEANSVTVVGGGFLGSELAFGIKRKYEKLQVTQVVPESGILGRILPEFLAVKATKSLRKFGVDVVTGAKIEGAKSNDAQLEIKLTGGEGKTLKTDYVVVAVGIEPETSVAEASGFEVDPKLGGVLADAELRVSPGVYCAGDACSFLDKALGRRRLEHHEHAQISGRLAGENMTGGEKAFWYQPSFFTKISPEYHINAVGNTDSALRTVSVFAKDDNGKGYDRGVVFYKNDEDKVVGVLMVNVFGPSLDVSRRLIEDARPVKDFRELSKLYPLYEPPKDDKEASSK